MTVEVQVLPCSHDYHEALKSDLRRWEALPFKYYWEMVPGHVLEYRGCDRCQSDIGVRVFNERQLAMAGVA